MGEPLWIATLQFSDGRQERFGVIEGALEMLARECDDPFLYLPLDMGGLVFVKTAGLQWLSITKDPS